MKKIRAYVSTSVLVMSLFVAGRGIPQVLALPHSPDAKQIALASNKIVGNWTAAVRLESGETFTLERINIMETDGVLFGFVSNGNEANALVKGAYRGNNFSLLVDYSSTNSPSYIPIQIQFDGKINGNNAAGTVTFRDSYRRTFKGTFTFARYGYQVTPPMPENPGGSGVSPINGTWRGEFGNELDYSYYTTRKTTPITLNLKQQGANIVGTGTFAGTPISVNGTLAGSAFNLVLSDSSGRMEIKGQFTESAMVGNAVVYSGGQQQQISASGKVRFTR